MSEPTRPRHFSMLRDFQFADVLTLGNGFAGTGMVLASGKWLVTHDRNYVWTAFALAPIALAFDFFDGRVARWRQKQSGLGQQLDSLADLVSFGVAPAMLAFALGLQGGWDAVVLLYFVACGISRLARYNVTAAALSDEAGKVRYFEGTPIPTSMTLVLVLGVLFHGGHVGDALPFGAIELGPYTLHPLVALWFASGSAMISKTLHVPKP